MTVQAESTTDVVIIGAGPSGYMHLEQNTLSYDWKTNWFWMQSYGSLVDGAVWCENTHHRRPRHKGVQRPR